MTSPSSTAVSLAVRQRWTGSPRGWVSRTRPPVRVPGPGVCSPELEEAYRLCVGHNATSVNTYALDMLEAVCVELRAAAGLSTSDVFEALPDPAIGPPFKVLGQDTSALARLRTNPRAQRDAKLILTCEWIHLLFTLARDGVSDTAALQRALELMPAVVSREWR